VLIWTNWMIKTMISYGIAMRSLAIKFLFWKFLNQLPFRCIWGSFNRHSLVEVNQANICLIHFYKRQSRWTARACPWCTTPCRASPQGVVWPTSPFPLYARPSDSSTAPSQWQLGSGNITLRETSHHQNSSIIPTSPQTGIVFQSSLKPQISGSLEA